MKRESALSLQLNSFLITAIVAACAAPTAALNIWPRIENILAKGVSGNEVGIVILVTMSALGMAAVPFAMRKAESRAFWWVCLLAGLSLAGVNYLMAVGAIGKVRDQNANEAAATIFKNETLSAQLKELRAARGTVEPKPVTPSMLSTGHEAVKLAIAARDQECGIVGNNCRARVAQVATRQEELGTLERDAAAFERYQGLSRKIERIEAELTTGGPPPRHIDAQAARIASILGYGGTTGEIERVANWIINALAITAEGFALLMPRIIVTALSRNTVFSIPAPVRPLSLFSPKRLLPPRASKTVSTTAGSKAIRGPEGPPLPPINVPLWFKSHVKVAPGRLLKAWDAYQHYKKISGNTEITQMQFGFEMQELKVKEEKIAGRSAYRNLKLT